MSAPPAVVHLPFFPPDLFDDDRDVLLDVLREVGLDPEQRFILGGRTARFERALTTWLTRDTTVDRPVETVACGSGTGALGLVLQAMGVGPGVEVVVPAFGCAPLAASVVNLGATPVFADIDPLTMVIDPDDARCSVTGRTGAIVAAHMFSVMADMPRFREIATHHGLRLVEDAAVAQGAALAGRPAGLWGDAGLFSFVQVKTFGMPGEGGVVVTGDPALASAVRMLRNHGQDGRQRFVHHRVGHNSRFDEIQAAFQLHRLPALAGRLARRAAIAEYYTERFAPLPGITPPPPGREGRGYYVYSLLATDRDALRDHLAGRGIGAHVYYPDPLPHQPAFAGFAPPGRRWPHAEQAAATTLAIPVYPHLSDAQVEYVADAVAEFARR
ncbi:aminotransferase DegT [Actinophytocola xinjiangensis]|uniref:Aminotransferase DegT n=1 Tax=Actinophytocola xinjiangensis TaxID=485602 RepID=A0A7Z0WRJ4_9PSEU|nr:DegT/DnrJ/EryC1/StrS family aminotransferase [Actinophytocola xinjiangensis]OLF13136.1 aminotransferase DegT [Actinophytocola xinjiangensis]